MIHTASLMHDDVVDESPTRRGEAMSYVFDLLYIQFSIACSNAKTRKCSGPEQKLSVKGSVHAGVMCLSEQCIMDILYMQGR